MGCCCSFGQKRNVFFIHPASHLLYVPPHFLWLDLPQRLWGCFALFHVMICCRWDGHVTLLLTVVGLGAVTAQDVGAQQLLPVRWWAIISAGLIIFKRDWCTGQLNSPGDCKLQAPATGFTMEKWVYLNSCYSCFSAQYWLLLWDKRQAVAYGKRTLQNPKSPPRTVLKICDMISGELRDCEILICVEKKKHAKQKIKNKTNIIIFFYGW